ncbi:MAG: adenylate cyclase [Granulosicoccus sp.]
MRIISGGKEDNMQTKVLHEKRESAPAFKKRPSWYGRVPITITLAAAIGTLVFTTAVVVFGVGVGLARKNTFDLLSANSQQAIEADVNLIEKHLRPAEFMAEFMAERIARDDIDQTNRDDFGHMLVGALSGAPQVEAVMFIDADLQSFVAGRGPSEGEMILNEVDYSLDPIIRESILKVQEGPVWVPPIWRDDVQRAYLSRAHPVIRAGHYIGAVVAVVSVQNLSDFISEGGADSNGHRFILYGREHVLAHWLMMDGYPDLSNENPLPRIDKFGDPVLASIWQERGRHELPFKFREGVDSHLLELFDDEYAFLYKTHHGFGEQPLIVGTYFQASDFPEELERFFAALIAGLIALFLSLVSAVLLGRRIARPIVQFSTAAARIQDLDVSKVEELPGSVFRELNDQSIAFNSMLRALRWFEQYVPRKIVEHLIRHGEIQDTNSDAQEITVLFTDVAGFSTISEDMSAPEVAAFVNHHFSMVVGCIEAEGGTVDKFMGDAVMAFWGGRSDANDSSAQKACRAARAISNAIREDNKRRHSLGLPMVGIRIGIHTGMATVGNIGAPGRLNYTVIGDTVNVGQRLEQLGKEIYSQSNEISILISGPTARHLDSSFTPVAAGNFKLKGRVGEIEVFKLE